MLKELPVDATTLPKVDVKGKGKAVMEEPSADPVTLQSSSSSSVPFNAAAQSTFDPQLVQNPQSDAKGKAPFLFDNGSSLSLPAASNLNWADDLTAMGLLQDDEEDRKSMPMESISVESMEIESDMGVPSNSGQQEPLSSSIPSAFFELFSAPSSTPWTFNRTRRLNEISTGLDSLSPGFLDGVEDEFDPDLLWVSLQDSNGASSSSALVAVSVTEEAPPPQPPLSLSQQALLHILQQHNGAGGATAGLTDLPPGLLGVAPFMQMLNSPNLAAALGHGGGGASGVGAGNNGAGHGPIPTVVPAIADIVIPVGADVGNNEDVHGVIAAALEKRPARINVNTSTLLRVSQCCPMLKSLNLAFCPLAQDYLIAETGEYLSSLLYTPAEYLTRVAITPTFALAEIARRCKELVSLDLRGCDWVTQPVVEGIVEAASGLKALNLVKCPRIKPAAAKLYLVRDVVELRELVKKAFDA
ncbi:hypothetical protein HDU96_006054 [Phlyctochytrium bullatum]|nr:hypothetical protein HDU96_006054 [Phlyctochytrium bullatum]